MASFGGISAAFWRALGLGGISNKETGEQRSEPASRVSDSGVVVSDQRAMQVAAVWSCARLITETVGSLPLHVYERDGDTRKAAEGHYLDDILRVSPNAMMTPQEFREALTLQLVLWGNGYAQVEWSANRVTSLIPLRPDCMKPMRSDAGLTYHYSTEKGTHVFAQKNILHLKGFSVDGIVGLSPLGYAAHTLGLTVSADRFASKSYSTGGRPAGVLTTDKTLNQEQREQIRSIYGNIQSEDSNGTWVLEAGLGYQAISIPPDQMQMLQSRQFQLGEIARIFRVPSHMIFDSEKATTFGSGIESIDLQFLKYTLRPYMTRWESSIANSLLSRADRRKYFVSHNVEGLLRADSAARAAFYASAVQNGWMTRNEVRLKDNLPPVTGADDLTVQVNMTPIQDLPKVTGDGNKEQPN